MGVRHWCRCQGAVVIIGTAGHIDHGKTALVRALTGVDTDRIPEEQRRGITIELGFAPLRLGDGSLSSIVDVPGHESLVRTMVAGAAGIDAALLVVAADEGVMPQTREHLRVLTALGVRTGVVAVSKSDLVDREWLDLVIEEIRSTLASTVFADVEILPVSARNGDGVSELLATLRSIQQTIDRDGTARDREDLFRFVVDRSFTLRGTGTVVTGTVWSGHVDVGSRVVLHPGGGSSRVRSIHAHGSDSNTAEPGRRYALALADVAPTAAPHGTQLVSDPAWTETRIICADVRLEPVTGAHDMSGGRRTPARGRDFLLYMAGSEARARLTTLARSNSADAEFDAVDRVRIVLDRALVARRGDRFVLRAGSPLDTVGGGVIVDPAPERGVRGAWRAHGTTATDRLSALLTAAGAFGVSIDTLPVRLGVPRSAVASAIAAAGGLATGPTVVALSAVEALGKQIEKRVRAWHAAHPLEGGIPVATLREELSAPVEVVDHAVAELCAGARYELREGALTQTADRSALSDRDAELLARLLQRICDAGPQPPSVPELVQEFGTRAEALVRFGARGGNLIAVESVRYYDASVVRAQIGQMRGSMEAEREYSPQELRDVLGVSRKYLIPFLEYCDRIGLTERCSGGRALRAVTSR